MSEATAPMPTEAHEGCEQCRKLAAEQAASADTSFAFLLALVPVLALSFFGNVGLL